MLSNVIRKLGVLKREFRGELEVLRPLSFLEYRINRFLGFKQYIKVKTKIFDKEIYVRRKNNTDISVIKYVFFEQFHLPPDDIVFANRPVILDLGSNIGLTISDFKSRFPSAIVYGFEMDEDNFHIAQLNCGDLKDVKIENAAVWYESGEITYDKSTGTDAYRIGSSKGGKLVRVNCFTINDILLKNGILDVDFLKMDIEGAELGILENGNLDWLKVVKAFNIEFHDLEDEKLLEIVELFRTHGFNAWKDSNHWCSIKGFRP